MIIKRFAKKLPVVVFKERPISPCSS